MSFQFDIVLGKNIRVAGDQTNGNKTENKLTLIRFKALTVRNFWGRPKKKTFAVLLTGAIGLTDENGSVQVCAGSHCFGFRRG